MVPEEYIEVDTNFQKLIDTFESNGFSKPDGIQKYVKKGRKWTTKKLMNTSTIVPELYRFNNTMQKE